MSVHADIMSTNRRIWVWSDTPITALKQDIPGASFSTFKFPHWSVPLELETCRRLRARFGATLEIGRSLHDWAWAERRREESLTALGKESDAELKRVPERYPALAEAMSNRTYQRVGARFIVEGRQVLIADQPGLGKTLEALAGVVESDLPGPYLVVCPKTAVESVWKPEIERWLPGQYVVTVPDGRAKRDAILNEFLQDDQYVKYQPDTWVVVHPEMIRTKSWWVCECEKKTPVWAGPKELDCGHDPKNAPRADEHEFPQLFAVDWSVIIADESDRMLIRKTGHPTQTRNGAELLRVRSGGTGGLRIAMSGTPMRGRPKLLWSTLNWLRPKSFTSSSRFIDQHFEVSYSGYGGSRVIGPLSEAGQEALYRTLGGLVLRRTKAEVAKDMPAKTYVGTPLDPSDPLSPVGIWLPMEGVQKTQHDRFVRDSRIELDGGTLDAIGTLPQRTGSKRFASSAGRMYGDGFEPTLPSNKYDYIVQLMEELGIPLEGPKNDGWDPATKLIVVSQFTGLLNLFAEKVRSSVLLTGQVTGPARAKAIADFNKPAGSDSPHVMFLNTKAGGVAITIDSADHMVFLDETEVPDDQEQAEDRIHRVSKPRPVFYHYLRSKDSIEESIAVLAAQRAADTAQVLDGRRGVASARQVQER